MTDFGRFRLSYEPGKSDPHSDILDHTVEMTISGEADLNNLLPFFTCFLRASGYIVDGEVQIVNDRDNDPWWKDATCGGGRATDFPDRPLVDEMIHFGNK